jgi:hypothetical protein
LPSVDKIDKIGGKRIPDPPTGTPRRVQEN